MYKFSWLKRLSLAYVIFQSQKSKYNFTSKSRSASAIEIRYLIDASSFIVAGIWPTIVPICFTMFARISVFTIALILISTGNIKLVYINYLLRFKSICVLMKYIWLRSKISEFCCIFWLYGLIAYILQII